MTEVIRYDQLDLSKIDYTKPEHQQNFYYGSMSYSNSNACYIQTAKMTFVGIRDDKASKKKYLVVTVDPHDFSFYDSLVKLDDHNLSTTYKSSKEWFQKELPMDVLETMYRPITCPFKKDDIPEIELMIPVTKQKIQCTVYNQSNDIISVDDLGKGATIIGVIHIRGLKFLKKDYYCDMCVSQIKLCQSIPYSIANKCLIVDEEESSHYDYEILDEEVIIRDKHRLGLKKQVDELQIKINSDQNELSVLQTEIDNLN